MLLSWPYMTNEVFTWKKLFLSRPFTCQPEEMSKNSLPSNGTYSRPPVVDASYVIFQIQIDETEQSIKHPWTIPWKQQMLLILISTQVRNK